MSNPYSNNVLCIQGLNEVSSPQDCYLATLKLLQSEFPKGYIEPDVLLQVLYADHFPNIKAQIKRKLLNYTHIDWLTANGHHTLHHLFSLLHAYFGIFPNDSLDEIAFHKAYKEFEEWMEEE